MSMESQMIGRRGEKRFDLLCSEANVTCNKSSEDDYGWDKLIEFPPRLVPFAAIDMQPGRTIAAVQIKTTTGSSRSVSISLSNALHYARSTVPQFIVLVVLEAGETRYFVRHVWGPLIAHWLKAGREADAKGVTAVNRETVSVAFSAQDERSSDLLGWIERQIDAVPRPYAASKQLIVDTVGFQDGHGTAKMTLATEGPHDFLDLQLGLKSEFKVKRFTYTSKRFGITAGRPEIEERDVVMQITPEGRAAAIRLELPDGGSVTIPATVYGADDGKSTAIRLASRVLDVIYGPSTRARANAELQRDERVKLEELRAFAYLMSATPGAGVRVQLDLDAKLMDMGTITMKGAGAAPRWPWRALAVDVMRSIADNAGRDAPDLTIAELDEAAGQLEVLNALASERAIRIDFTPTGEIEPQFDGLLAYACANVGGHVFAAVSHRAAKLDRTVNGRRQLTFGPSRLLWGQVAASDGWSDKLQLGAYQRQLERLSVDGQVMAIGDLAKMVEDGRRERELSTTLPPGRGIPLKRRPRRRKG